MTIVSAPSGATPVTAPHAAAHERYRPELDGIRALCIVLTIFNHVPGTPLWINGTVGVDIFFALSGWLITVLLLRERQATGTVSLSAFYIRRAFRILPLYYLTAAAYAALALAGAKSGGVDELRHAAIAMLTVCMEYRPDAAGNLFGHAWTLGVEEKFYLLWPAILVATIRRPALAAPAAAIALALLFAAFGVTTLILRGYLGLSFGAGLAMLAFHTPRVERLLRSRFGVAPFLLLMLAAYAASIVRRDAAVWNVVLAFGAALTIGTLWFQRDLPVGRWLSAGPLPWLGRLTYAIYLIQSICIRVAETGLRALHIPATVATIFLAAYALSVGAAWLIHVGVEGPMIRMGRQLARRAAARR